MLLDIHVVSCFLQRLIINQQQPKFCAIFFSKINPDAHVSTKTDTFTFYRGPLEAIIPRSQRNVK